jgi:hypothetical protein
MSNASKKLKLAGLNLIAPGVAHFAMRRWWRGLLYLLSTIGCVAWALISFFQIMIGNIYAAADGKTPTADVWSVFIPIGATLAIWIVSYIDLMLTRANETEKELADAKAEVENSRGDRMDRAPDPAMEGMVRREVAKQLRELEKEGKIKFIGK